MNRKEKVKVAKCLAHTKELPNSSCSCWTLYQSLPPEMAEDLAKLVREVESEKRQKVR